MLRRGLGKGLDALIPNALSSVDGNLVREVRLEEIAPNPYQPRQSFDEVKLADLAQSVKEHGVLQPVLVRRVGIDRYELIAGERRVRAARQAGLATIPAIVKEYEQVQQLEVALIENLQREDINPVEAAQAYQRLRTEFGLTQEEIARRVGKSQPSIANTLRLLALPNDVLDSIQRGEISEGHARAILQAPPQAQGSVWQDVKRRGLSVRETERLVRELGTKPESKEFERQPSAHRDANLASVEDALQAALGTKVRIQSRGISGRIEIEFYTEEHLEALIERLLASGAHS